ncbi:hypothetical protein Fuma_01066 [Fuerstiella marisgermanici]|uniref:Uncharacterized protein n=1 Tax=Fuerstiella marisgermanici TaxID=1891926 RepID=A0A1P8WBP2_9PLAN|nr:hypothetical protein Fuma_01066 [Fuerstiella marisgermanici]
MWTKFLTQTPLPQFVAGGVERAQQVRGRADRKWEAYSVPRLVRSHRPLPNVASLVRPPPQLRWREVQASVIELPLVLNSHPGEVHFAKTSRLFRQGGAVLHLFAAGHVQNFARNEARLQQVNGRIADILRATRPL